MRRVGIMATALSVMVAAPAAAHSAPALSSVLAHTRAADKALEKAVAAYDEHAFKKGNASYRENRSQMRAAVAETAQLIGDADTPEERREAAKAVVAVAKQSGDNERSFAANVRDTKRGSKAEDNVSDGVEKDAGRMETAFVQLQALATTVPAPAQEGIAKAAAEVALERNSAGRDIVAALKSSGVSRDAKESLVDGLDNDIDGQAHAVDLLQALKTTAPAQAQNGLDTALTAIAGSLDRQARRFGNASDNVPAWVAEKLAELASEARAAADDARGT